MLFSYSPWQFGIVVSWENTPTVPSRCSSVRESIMPLNSRSEREKASFVLIGWKLHFVLVLPCCSGCCCYIVARDLCRIWKRASHGVCSHYVPHRRLLPSRCRECNMQITLPSPPPPPSRPSRPLILGRGSCTRKFDTLPFQIPFLCQNQFASM